MADVIHEHVTRDSSSGASLMTGIILLIIVAILLFYGLPLIRNAASVQSPSFQVPSKIDVNVNQPKAP